MSENSVNGDNVMKNVNPLLGLGIVVVLVSSAAFVLAQRPAQAEDSTQSPSRFCP